LAKLDGISPGWPVPLITSPPLPATVVSEPVDGDDVREKHTRVGLHAHGLRWTSNWHTSHSDVAADESVDISRIAVASTAGARDGTAAASLHVN
jgi:hypothetical protein